MTSQDPEHDAFHAASPVDATPSVPAPDWVVDELFVATLELAACAATSDEIMRSRIIRVINRIDQVVPELRRRALAGMAETDGAARGTSTTRRQNGVSTPRGRPGESA